MKWIASILVFLVFLKLEAQEYNELEAPSPSFSIGYTLGTHLVHQPSHIFAFEYSNDQKNFFRLELGYIYKDLLYEENDPDVGDSGIRIMATYQRQSQKYENLLYGGGFLYRNVYIGNTGGIRNSEGRFERTEYYLKSNLTGIYYQLNVTSKLTDRLYVSVGPRIGFGVLRTTRDKAINPKYGNSSPGWGPVILSGDLFSGCWFCISPDIGEILYPIADAHITISYRFVN